VTTRKLPLSCFIIARNEADRIGRTIDSVSAFVDEVIVIDSGSTDATVSVAAEQGARVIFNPWPGFGQQKRFAEDQCRNDWLLNLDADEVVPRELAIEIEALFAAGPPSLAVYGCDVLDVYPGQVAPRRFAKDHYCLRLYDRRRARFRNDTLFDSVDAGHQTVGRLKGVLYHFSIRSLDHLAAKCNERATYNATHAKPKARWLLAVRLVTEMPMSFFKLYVLRRHFMGGWTGFQYAMIVAFYRFLRIVRMWEATRPPRATAS
jgi:glycosyltransferase involved in cell wall biosynthesis